jgi:NADH-quinone oxidoreductase subunit N
MSVDFTLIIPEFVLAGTAFAVLLVDLVIPAGLEHRRNALTASAAAVGLALAFVLALVTQWDTGEFIYAQLIFIDRYSLLFKSLFMGTGFAVVLMSVDYVGTKMRHPGEFYALIVFAVLGATLMSQAGELLTAFISIELLSFSLYVLVGLSRGDGRSAEASTKYILLGAISTAVMLYGISQLFGALGTTVFREMAPGLAAGFDLTIIIGFVMFVGGLGFKLSMVPFHLWAPDVYEGAPTPVTALISTLSKAAAFALTLRFLAEAGMGAIEEWRMAIAILAAATMSVGTLTALSQTNIKRLLAYSSIAQVGFVLVGVVSLSAAATNAVMLHLIGYAFANLAAFMVVIAVETKMGRERISDYAGLAQRAPVLAMVMTGAVFSLAGLPIFAGFVTKFYLFTAAAEEGLLWLVSIAVVNSVISLFYYLRIVRAMYIDEAVESSKLVLPALTWATLWALFAGTIAVGVYPGPWVDAIDAATRALGPFAGS